MSDIRELITALRTHVPEEEQENLNLLVGTLDAELTQLERLRGLGLEIDDVDQRGVGLFTGYLAVLRERDEMAKRLAGETAAPRSCSSCGREMEGSLYAGYTLWGEFHSCFQTNEVAYRCGNLECRDYAVMEVWTRHMPTLRLRFPPPPPGAMPGLSREEIVREAVVGLLVENGLVFPAEDVAAFGRDFAAELVHLFGLAPELTKKADEGS